MTHPQSHAQTDDNFDAVMHGMKASLASLVDRPASEARAGPPNPRPAVPAGPPAAAMWGPHTQPATTAPLQLLAQVADNTRKLHSQLLGLARDVTGEEPAFRARQVTQLPNALLPAIAALATEIDAVHCEIGRLVAKLRGDVS